MQPLPHLRTRTDRAGDGLELLAQQDGLAPLLQVHQQRRQGVEAVPPMRVRHVARQQRQGLGFCPKLLRLLSNTAAHALLHTAAGNQEVNDRLEMQPTSSLQLRKLTLCRALFASWHTWLWSMA